MLGGCVVGPNYSKPEAPVTESYKEAGDWVVAKPADTAPKGQWWLVFNDPELNQLIEKVAVDNQTLRAAEANYRQASAAVSAARSGLFPNVGASAGASRGRTAQNPSRDNYNVGLDARWEIDLWGRIRRGVEASSAAAEASAADLAGARLSLQAQLATSYFLLRVTDVQRQLFEDTLKAFQTSYRITQNRYTAGVAGKVDVVQAETQLKSVEAQEYDLRIVRAQLEHAIAVLIGQPPATLAIAPVKFQPSFPVIPPGLPSTLLERRPDVAAAERRMAAANARIGVAQAAYFPALSLTGALGFTNDSLSNLISTPNRIWSLGAGLGLTLLDFGARGAQVDITRAAYDEALADYRQTVLGAFQDVEDSLASVRWLAEEARVQEDAARLARESVTLTLNQYRAGTAGTLELVIVQASQFSEERQLGQLLGRRLAATVSLIRALGGEWQPPNP
jgi:NodT family efflux transporter outer membrane factor (OMF) lipoprotein